MGRQKSGSFRVYDVQCAVRRTQQRGAAVGERLQGDAPNKGVPLRRLPNRAAGLNTEGPGAPILV